ncbi:Arginyl-tRNA--protein transferase 1 [Thelotrema lepadinum]|nr:Arginyl-tRNA--protein transferase 1 [Thelotrema lepadinum]
MASIMTPLGYQYNSCGYCKSDDGSPNYYGHSPRTVKPLHYQALADKGPGRLTTSPTCDTHAALTILYGTQIASFVISPAELSRLDSSQFKPTRNQRRVCNRFTSWIVGDDYPGKAAKLCPKSREEKRDRKNNFDVHRRIHEADYDNIPKPINPSTGKSIEPSHKLEVSLEPDQYTEEKYALFAHYQKVVHKEPPSRISKRGFKGFLCSGMAQTVYDDDGKERKIGSYHQCYRIDGRLVAMGVLDLMPHCVSSVYLMYHQDFNDWEFGKLSALREIAMATEKGYRYYYMGYYIHSCTKMKYKRDFYPTYVLDPESYEWNLFDQDLLTRMNTRKYVSISRERRLGIGAGDAEPEEVDGSHKAGAGLFASNMPGIAQPEEIKEKVAGRDVQIMYEKCVINLKNMQWDLEEMRGPNKSLGVIAEFIACIGIENVKDWILALSYMGDEEEEG